MKKAILLLMLSLGFLSCENDDDNLKESEMINEKEPDVNEENKEFIIDGVWQDDENIKIKYVFKKGEFKELESDVFIHGSVYKINGNKVTWLNQTSIWELSENNTKLKLTPTADSSFGLIEATRLE